MLIPPSHCVSGTVRKCYVDGHWARWNGGTAWWIYSSLPERTEWPDPGEKLICTSDSSSSVSSSPSAAPLCIPTPTSSTCSLYSGMPSQNVPYCTCSSQGCKDIYAVRECGTSGPGDMLWFAFDAQSTGCTKLYQPGDVIYVTGPAITDRCGAIAFYWGTEVPPAYIPEIDTTVGQPHTDCDDCRTYWGL